MTTPRSLFVTVLSACTCLLPACTSGEQPAPPPSSAPPSATNGGADDVSKQRAGVVVTDRYGGRVLDVEADHHDGESAWEVEVADSDQGRIEVDVSRRTGEIVEIERD